MIVVLRNFLEGARRILLNTTLFSSLDARITPSLCLDLRRIHSGYRLISITDWDNHPIRGGDLS